MEMSRDAKRGAEGVMEPRAEASKGAGARSAEAEAAQGAPGAAGARDAGAPDAPNAEAAGARDAGAAAGTCGAGIAAPAQDAGARRFAIGFDSTRCVKCWACEVACRQWSGLAADAPARRWVREEVHGTFPRVERVFVSEGCRHCADAPCVAACAFGALGQRADGRVTVDAARCAGCGRCAAACPHAVPRFMASGVMDKCDGCFAAGVPDGAAPHCVTTCPTGALTFFGLADESGGLEGTAADGPSCASAAAPGESECAPRGAADAPAGCEGARRAEGMLPGEGEGSASSSPLCNAAGGLRAAAPPAWGDERADGAARPAERTAPGVSADELAGAYGLLAALVMREVPAAFLAALRDNLPAAPEPLAAYVRSLQGADLDREAEELAVDFATVLLGMSPHPVFPYESAYADGDRLLMRPVRDDVVRAYAAAGFAVDPALCLPEDHLAFELAFVSHLARCEADAWAAGDEASAVEAAARRAAFERDHLGSWVPRFAADWARASASPFYQALARLLVDLTAPA